MYYINITHCNQKHWLVMMVYHIQYKQNNLSLSAIVSPHNGFSTGKPGPRQCIVDCANWEKATFTAKWCHRQSIGYKIDKIMPQDRACLFNIYAKVACLLFSNQLNVWQCVMLSFLRNLCFLIVGCSVANLIHEYVLWNLFYMWNNVPYFAAEELMGS